MMAYKEIVYINFTGGIIHPNYLKEVLEIAAAANVANVSFGLRQQLVIQVPARHYAQFSAACAEKSITFHKRRNAPPNIISSYTATGIFTADSWLREGVYKDVFDLFDYVPSLKINICDNTQSLVPFFTGHINWISSALPHFWYLYIRFPKSNGVFFFSELVYTNDIAAVSRHIEQLVLVKKVTDIKELSALVKTGLSYISRPADKELHLPSFSLPYYEGFNKHDNSYWLGIYRRNELFPIQFLIELCSICLTTKIGQMYTTPWKSIIIKGIESHQRNLWDFILGKYRINVRHAASELNWQIEDNSETGLMIKRSVISHFDKQDTRTYGLSFAVQTKPFSSLFGSIVIRKEQVNTRSRLKSLDRYEILFSPDFNSNTSKRLTFRQHVEKDHLGPYLVSLCKMFYDKETLEKHAHLEVIQPVTNTDSPVASSKMVHQCRYCYTIYDPSAGDTGNNIPPGTPFANLPSAYTCTVCDAGKEDFTLINENSLKLLDL